MHHHLSIGIEVRRGKIEIEFGHEYRIGGGQATGLPERRGQLADPADIDARVAVRHHQPGGSPGQQRGMIVGLGVDPYPQGFSDSLQHAKQVVDVDHPAASTPML